MSSDKPITVLVIGYGNRGHVYSSYALDHPERCQIVGIAEPNEARRLLAINRFKKTPETIFHVFSDWHDIFSSSSSSSSSTAALSSKSVGSGHKKLADAVLITLQDRDHTEAALAFAGAGYHMLLEKPMACTQEDCEKIATAVEQAGVIFAIGHVLRYTPYSRLFYRLVNEQKVVGDVINMQHLEPIGFAHAAHSYVRGNWGRESVSSPLLLAKSCHDLDWMLWMMQNKACVGISSSGSRKHFRKEAKPAAAGDAQRCLSCSFESSCPYSAKKLYLDGIPGMDRYHWASKIADPAPDGSLSDEAVRAALVTGPYGRCVYECDNDVLDNQVVLFKFEDGATATFTCVAFSKDVCQRRTTVFGHLGELQGDGDNTIIHYDFTTGQATTYLADQVFPPVSCASQLSGHGAGDFHLIHNFISAIATQDPSKVACTVREALNSHLLVFYAEQARKTQTFLQPSTSTLPSLEW